MYIVSSYTVQLLHEDRLRDAQKRFFQSQLLRDMNEQAPVESHISLWQQIKQRFSVKQNVAKQPPQETAHVRRRAA